MDKLFGVLKVLLAAGGPAAFLLSSFLGFGTEDANKLVEAIAAIASFVGLFLLVGPKILTPNQMAAAAKGLLTAGGPLGVVLTMAFHMESAVVEKTLQAISVFAGSAGLLWTILSGRDSAVLMQALNVKGVSSIAVDPSAHNTPAGELAKDDDITKVQFLMPESGEPPAPPPDLSSSLEYKTLS